MVKLSEKNTMRLDFQDKEVQARFLSLFRYAQVGRCVNGVTHDINNVLGVISAYAELVSMDESISDDARRMLNDIVEGVIKCSTMISSLTDIAREEKCNESMADPASIVHSLECLFNYELRTKKIQFEVICEDTIPSIMADPPKLQLALIYLLFNAYEALSGCEKKRIRFSVEKTDTGVCFIVWNSGPEMTHHEIIDKPELFQTTKKSGPHLGLGLKAVRNIVELHDGTLAYDPQKGFSLEIPCRSRLKNLMD